MDNGMESLRACAQGTDNASVKGCCSLLQITERLACDVTVTSDLQVPRGMIFNKVEVRIIMS